MKPSAREGGAGTAGVGPWSPKGLFLQLLVCFFILMSLWGLVGEWGCPEDIHVS